MDETDGVKSINPAMLQVAALLVDLPVTTLRGLCLNGLGNFHVNTIEALVLCNLGIAKTGLDAS